MKNFHLKKLLPGGLLLCCAVASAQLPAEPNPQLAPGFRMDNISRPPRYTPVGPDFVITNGGEFFNRPLYGGSFAFRVDAGDVPEFSLYLPGRGGNVRLGMRAGEKSIWLHQAKEVVAIYRPGKMLYEIRDPLLGRGVLRLEALATRATEGFVLCAELAGGENKVELLFAFGGVNGLKGRRDGDIGCEREPVANFSSFNRSNAAAIKSTFAPTPSRWRRSQAGK